MIHEIAPHVTHNEYKPHPPRPNDYIVIYGGGLVLMDCSDEKSPRMPQFSEVERHSPKLTFLFSIDDDAFYLLAEYDLPSGLFTEAQGFKKQPLFTFNMLQPKHMAFAALTAAHLAGWYEKRRICGRCGEELTHSTTERKMECPKCKLEEFPQINPVVIIGVTNGDKIMVTRYANRPVKHYALVAGYAEIGESFEECVSREVMEEVGLRVKNVRFYKSQPWAMSGSLLAGFYCDLDGDDTVTLQEDELSEGVWMTRAELPPQNTDIALTAEMIERFRLGLENVPVN